MNTQLVQQSGASESVPAGQSAAQQDVSRRFMETFGHSHPPGPDAIGAALAHELNQPLAALTIYLQSLRRLCSKQPDVTGVMQEFVDKSLREAERAGEIVRRMRRFSSRSEPERQAISINSLADESIELAFIAVTRPVKVTKKFGIAMPPLTGDPVQIRQVMVNLLRNAIDATSKKAKPQIAVSTISTNGFIQFNVADNGPGVSPRIADRLFRAFETSKPQGMGLGLAISRMIAQNHGGDLVLEPMGIDGGACFGLKLPVR